MKKIIVFVIIVGAIVSCSRREPLQGIVGRPVHLAVQVKSPDDTLGCTFRWDFTKKPIESNMDILSFQPDSKSFNVYFMPDVEGEYRVRYLVVDSKEKVVDEREYIVEVTADTTKREVPAEPEVIYPEEVKVETTRVIEPEVEKAVTESIYVPLQPTTPKREIRGESIPKIEDLYTIQISSWKTYNGAKRTLEMLKEFGINAYIQKAYFQESSETWYRVRTGIFNSYREAKIAMEDLCRKLPNEDIWIDYMRED